jgi:hypothetical protein|tara:strand:+ start:12 stop:206 length:195 start_codon:yes stop_codon:yes gene_type:complete
MPGRKMSKYMAKGGKYMAKGGKFMAKRGGKFMAKRGGVKKTGKTMTVAQIRAAAKKKGYKLVKS